MGIDVYASWRGITEQEQKARYTGFSIKAGHVGYLREAYHGGPYATAVLCGEERDGQELGMDEEGEYTEGGYAGVPIPAATLRSRLPRAALAALIRDATVYNDTAIRRWLAEKLAVEAAVEQQPIAQTGDGTDFFTVIARIFREEIPAARGEQVVPRELPPELVLEARALCDQVESLYAFVELCERKEQETGEPCRIVFSG